MKTRRNKIATNCYNKTKLWNSREEAIEYFKDCMDGCDFQSSEYDRYASIVAQLEGGADYASDENIGSVHEARKSRRFNENRKITLTLGQLKRLVRESYEDGIDPKNRDELEYPEYADDDIVKALAAYDVYVLNNKVHYVLGMTGLVHSIDHADIEKLREYENEIYRISREYGETLRQAIEKKGYDYDKLWRDSHRLADKMRR